MKNKCPLLLVLVLAVLFPVSSSFAQGTLFTYQGKLDTNGSPFNGTVSLRFKLFSDSAGNNQVGGTFLTNNVGVAGGLFTTGVDFGAGIFTGSNYFLLVGVSTNGGSSFTDLSPLQAVTATPYAIMANSASNLLGTLPVGKLSGTVGNGQLANSSITVTAGTGLSGGGTVALGGTTTLSNAGVLSVTSTSTDVTANTAAGVVTIGSDATDLPSENTIVRRDSGAGFAAGLINAGQLDTADGQITEDGELLLYDDLSGGFFVGPQAGNTQEFSLSSTGVGFQALTSITQGRDNTAVGERSLSTLTDGFDNTAIGNNTLLVNNGGGNTAVGALVMSSNTNNFNTAVGLGALFFSENAASNIAIGALAGTNLVNGSNNIYIGSLGGGQFENDTIRIGDTNFQTNTFIAGLIHGNGGGLTNLSGAQLGGSATLTNLTLNGTLTLPQLSSDEDLILGNGGATLFLYGDNSQNFYGGGAGGPEVGNGSDNTSFGSGALINSFGGSDNTAYGAGALNGNETGANNTAIGANALLGLGVGASTLGGSNNIALGFNAGSNFRGNESSNIDIGNVGVNGENNTIRIGTPGIQTNTVIAGLISGDGGGLTNVTAAQLTGSVTMPAISAGNPSIISAGGASSVLVAYGDSAQNFFGGGGGLTNTSGSDNTALGSGAFHGGTSHVSAGSIDTAFGAGALFALTSGNGNTAIGDDALVNLPTGSSNTAVGALAGNAYTTHESNNIVIGNTGATGDTNVIRIGNNQVKTFVAGISGATAASGVEVFVNTSGQLGTLTSSEKYKRDIQDMDDSSDVLLSLRPVTFKYKEDIDPQGTPQFGLVAEEVAKADPELVAHDAEGNIYTVRYQAVNAMLLNEFQKEHRKVEAQDKEIEDLIGSVKAQSAENAALKARLDKLEHEVK